MILQLEVAKAHLMGGDSAVCVAGRKPFGLMADFRIYARSLPDEQVALNQQRLSESVAFGLH